MPTLGTPGNGSGPVEGQRPSAGGGPGGGSVPSPVAIPNLGGGPGGGGGPSPRSLYGAESLGGAGAVAGYGGTESLASYFGVRYSETGGGTAGGSSGSDGGGYVPNYLPTGGEQDGGQTLSPTLNRNAAAAEGSTDQPAASGSGGASSSGGSPAAPSQPASNPQGPVSGQQPAQGAHAPSPTPPSGSPPGASTPSSEDAQPDHYNACFAAGTPVLLADGRCKPIEEIQQGDLILSASEHGPEGPTEPKSVLEVYYNRPNHLISLHLGDAVVRVTLNHPIYVRSRGWVPAARLRVGDELRGQDGRWLAVTDLFDNGDIEPVFNLRVAEFRTYFVGCEQSSFVLVHNQSEEDVQDILKALGGGKKEQAEKEKNRFGGLGNRTWTDGTGKFKTEAELIGIDGNNIRLRKPDGTVVPVPIDKLSESDQQLIRGLKAMPSNVVLDGPPNWKEKVIRDFARLSETKKGKELLESIKKIGEGDPTIGGLAGLPENTTPITIVPRAGGDNKTTVVLGPGGKAKSVTIKYNPDDTQGDQVEGGSRERPPFVGLGKELFTAARALRGEFQPIRGGGPLGINLAEERWSRQWENELRAELGLRRAEMP